MSNSNKIKSINKQLNSIFKDLKSLPVNDVNKILFNIELLKNKYLYRNKQGKVILYEVSIRDIIKIVDIEYS